MWFDGLNMEHTGNVWWFMVLLSCSGLWLGERILCSSRLLCFLASPLLTLLLLYCNYCTWQRVTTHRWQINFGSGRWGGGSEMQESEQHEWLAQSSFHSFTAGGRWRCPRRAAHQRLCLLRIGDALWLTRANQLHNNSQLLFAVFLYQFCAAVSMNKGSHRRCAVETSAVEAEGELKGCQKLSW